MHWEILDSRRKKILPQLVFAKSYKFYLAGGTALALHFGHRTSIDFDFYTPEKFDEARFEQEVVQHLKGFIVTQRSTGTLIGRLGVIDLSFFYYSYPLLEPLLETEHLNILSVLDIAAMKLIAISQRGVRRDFLDLYTIAQKHSLDQIFDGAKKKFSQFDPYVCLKGLTYFKDADEDESGRGMDLKNSVPWSKIKTFFERETKRLVKKWL